MDYLNVFITSLSMSMDASTVGAVDGVKEVGMKIKKKMLIAFLFGFLQFLMPLIGYFIGYSFKEYIVAYIPYIAFSLLFLLALKSFIDFLKSRNNNEIVKERISFKEIIIQGIATSIDAFSIGFVFLNYEIKDAMITFVIIGIVTFILSFITINLGNLIASKLEKYSGLISALIFLAVGIKILIEGII